MIKMEDVCIENESLIERSLVSRYYINSKLKKIKPSFGYQMKDERST